MHYLIARCIKFGFFRNTLGFLRFQCQSWSFFSWDFRELVLLGQSSGDLVDWDTLNVDKGKIMSLSVSIRNFFYFSSDRLVFFFCQKKFWWLFVLIFGYEITIINVVNNDIITKKINNMNWRKEKRSLLNQVRLSVQREIKSSGKTAKQRIKFLQSLSRSSCDLENPTFGKVRPGALVALKTAETVTWLFILPFGFDASYKLRNEVLKEVEVISVFDERFKFLCERSSGALIEIGEIVQVHWWSKHVKPLCVFAEWFFKIVLLG